MYNCQVATFPVMLAIKVAKRRYRHVSRRIIILISLFTLAVVSVRAQYDPLFSHYWAMEPSFNPAAVGKENKLNVAVAYAIDFAGYENNPRTAYAGADMPLHFLRSYHGVGLSIFNDKIGLFTHQKIAAQYAYRFKLLGGRLAVGVQPALITETFDGSKADPEDPGDPAIVKSELDGHTFDLSVGLYYTHKNWYAGASVQHVNAPKVSLGETNELKIDATYYFTGGYNIKLRNPFLTIPTNLLVRYDGHDHREDIGARLQYKNENKMLYGGASYSPKHSATVHIGGSFHGVNLGYSYEIYTSGIKPGNGSHELLVTYQTDINFQKKGRNKHKSVRYL